MWSAPFSRHFAKKLRAPMLSQNFLAFIVGIKSHCNHSDKITSLVLHLVVVGDYVDTAAALLTLKDRIAVRALLCVFCFVLSLLDGKLPCYLW